MTLLVRFPTARAALLACAVGCWSGGGNAAASETHRNVISGQSIVYMRGAHPYGCGIRLIGELHRKEAPDSEVFDVSVNVYRSYSAVAKFVSFNTTPEELRAGKPVRKFHVLDGWIRTSDTTLARASDADDATSKDGYSILYSVSMGSALAVFRAVATAEPLSVGIRREGENSDTVFAGEVRMKQEDREEIDGCIAAMPK